MVELNDNVFLFFKFHFFDHISILFSNFNFHFNDGKVLLPTLCFIPCESIIVDSSIGIGFSVIVLFDLSSFALLVETLATSVVDIVVGAFPY